MKRELTDEERHYIRAQQARHTNTVNVYGRKKTKHVPAPITLPKIGGPRERTEQDPDT